MRSYIKSSDVQKRNSILNNTTDHPYPTRRCNNLFEIAKNSSNPIDIKNFLEECAEDSTNATEYAEACLDILDKGVEQHIERIFVESVLPKVDEYTLNDLSTKETSLSEAIHNQIVSNKICDRILRNHNALEETYDLSGYIRDHEVNVTSEQITHKCCEVVNLFNIPLYAKYNTAIEESTYLLQSTGHSYEEEDLISNILEYFYLSGDPTSRDKKQMDNVTKNNYCIKEGTFKKIPKKNKDNSLITKACTDFIYNSDHSIFDLTAVKSAVVNAETWDIKKHFRDFIMLLTNIMVDSMKESLHDFIIDTLLQNLYVDLYDRIVKDPEARSIFISMISATSAGMDKCDDMINTWDASVGQLIQFQKALENFNVQLTEALEFMYPAYTLECMLDRSLNEFARTMSLNEFKIFKFDNLITRFWKVDKFLQKQFNGFKKKFQKKITKMKSKIFESTSDYDLGEIVQEDGSIEYCVASYNIVEVDDRSQLHEFSTDLLHEINERLLEGEYTCYYLMNEDTLEFYVRENDVLIDPDEICTNPLSEENLMRAATIISAAQNIREDFDFITESVSVFTQYPDADFRTYLEACALAGISEEVIHNIYDTICDRVDSRIEFLITNSYYVNEYKPIYSTGEIMMEAAGAVQYILEMTPEERKAAAKKRQEEKLAQYEKEEEEEEKKSSEDAGDNNKKDDKKEEDSKEIAKDNPKKETKPEEKKSLPEKIKDFGKNFSLNNMKLYLAGLKKMAKDADSKIQTKIKNLDATGNRLQNALQKAVVSDRREAIIKGSIIPSFHKCIVLTAALAGMWVFNPPLAIISAVGGFAASKNLTKKERALMYDDIMIELELIDKEIQMADSKNQVKKMRQLMRTKKELERTAARIMYNARIGKDLIPGGHYINRSND